MTLATLAVLVNLLVTVVLSIYCQFTDAHESTLLSLDIPSSQSHAPIRTFLRIPQPLHFQQTQFIGFVSHDVKRVKSLRVQIAIQLTSSESPETQSAAVAKLLKRSSVVSASSVTEQLTLAKAAIRMKPKQTNLFHSQSIPSSQHSTISSLSTSAPSSTPSSPTSETSAAVYKAVAMRMKWLSDVWQVLSSLSQSDLQQFLTEVNESKDFQFTVQFNVFLKPVDSKLHTFHFPLTVALSKHHRPQAMLRFTQRFLPDEINVDSSPKYEFLIDYAIKDLTSAACHCNWQLLVIVRFVVESSWSEEKRQRVLQSAAFRSPIFTEHHSLPCDVSHGNVAVNALQIEIQPAVNQAQRVLMQELERFATQRVGETVCLQAEFSVALTIRQVTLTQIQHPFRLCIRLRQHDLDHAKH